MSRKLSPEITCTWDKTAECMNCTIKGELDCKWSRSLLLRFYKGGSLAMISGGLGLILVGLFVSWLPIIIYGAFWIFFFGFFEIRVLCSHCPYYAEEGRILHCLANHGTIKLWNYHPEPMNIFEKLGFLGGALFFGSFPVVAELWGLYQLWNDMLEITLIILILCILTVLSTVGGGYFFVFLSKKICPTCVNFSCPLNSVPKELVDAYLKKNPIIREAWERTGYKID